MFIATPSYSGTSSPYTYSLMHSVTALREAGWSVDWYHMEGNCHVDDARNYLVREFLASDCTDLVFVDADVGWQAEDLKKLLEYDRQIVAGIYPKKRDDAEWPVTLPAGEIWSDGDGLIEALRVPTGFLRILREVLQRMWDDEPRKFIGKNDAEDALPQAIIFERTFVDGNRISGDYSACDKFRRAGYRIFVDPEMRFVHQGDHEWVGIYGDHLREEAGIGDHHLKRAVRAMMDGNADDLGLFVNMVVEYGNENFSATPELLYTLFQVAMNVRGPMLETGTGLSTVVLGCVSALTGNELISLEHDKGWLLETRKLLNKAGLKHEPVFAPLDPDTGWYGFEDVPDLALALCDGPQRAHRRDGLFRLHGDRMRNAAVIIDDWDTIPEQSMVGRVTVLGNARKFAVGNAALSEAS